MGQVLIELLSLVYNRQSVNICWVNEQANPSSKHSFLCLFTKQEFTKQQLCENSGQVSQAGEQTFIPENSNKSGPTFSKPEGAESEVDFSLGLGVEVYGINQNGQRDKKQWKLSLHLCQAHVTLRIWSIIFLVRKLWPGEINWLILNWWTSSLRFLELIKKVTVDWTIGTCSMFWCLGFEENTLFPEKWKDSECGPRGNIWKRKGTSQSLRALLPWEGGDQGGISNLPGEYSGRGVISSAVDLTTAEFYQKVNFSRDSVETSGWFQFLDIRSI